MKVVVSATLVANEEISRRRDQGLPVLPMGFGQAGLPVHEALRSKLADNAHRNAYGAVAGSKELREAVAGYWDRRGLPTDPELIVSGPGSKSLLYGLLMAIGGDTAIAVPSWVSYAAQLHLMGSTPLPIPIKPGQGGVPNPELLAGAVDHARAQGRDVRSVIVTLPDNPTGTIARPDTIRQLCEVAEKRGLIIISDEIYRDLVFDASTELLSLAQVLPDQTVVTTGLSKNLALGGWRIGAARLPDSPKGRELASRLRGIASEIWSSPSTPIQHAAAYAFSEPPELVERITRSVHLHAAVARAVAKRFRAAGAIVVEPKGAFYQYPDFESWRDHLAQTYDITTGAELAKHFLHEYGLSILPASDFGESADALRFRAATSLLYGETDEQCEAALESEDPLSLPWIAEELTQLETILRTVSAGNSV